MHRAYGSEPANGTHLDWIMYDVAGQYFSRLDCLNIVVSHHRGIYYRYSHCGEFLILGPSDYLEFH